LWGGVHGCGHVGGGGWVVGEFAEIGGRGWSAGFVGLELQSLILNVYLSICLLSPFTLPISP
jgi:hypothetical protein